MTNTFGPGAADERIMFSWNVHLAEGDDDVVLYISGDLDMATWPAMEDALTAACSGPGEVVVVDVSALTFIDCGGLQLLAAANERLEAEGRRGLVVNGASGVVRRIFELTDLTSLLNDRQLTEQESRVPFNSWHHTRELQRVRQYAGISIKEWFVAYFALGGTASFERFGIHLSGGAAHLDSHQREIAVHALNERLGDLGLDDRVLSYASEGAIR